MLLLLQFSPPPLLPSSPPPCCLGCGMFFQNLLLNKVFVLSLFEDEDMAVLRDCCSLPVLPSALAVDDTSGKQQRRRHHAPPWPCVY